MMATKNPLPCSNSGLAASGFPLLMYKLKHVKKIVFTLTKRDTLLYIKFPPWWEDKLENEADDSYESQYLMCYGKALECYDCESNRRSYLITKHIFSTTVNDL